MNRALPARPSGTSASPAARDAVARSRRRALAPLLVAALALSSGCASNPPTGPVIDPFENANRRIYAFNTALDDAVLKPVARGYRFVLPDPLEDGIGNFFSNLAEPGIVVNDLLQGKFVQAASDTGRFLVNSTVGLLGFIDVGSRIGLEKHRESLGQTLGVWGVGEGPFLMVPLLGPNNARSATGFAVEAATTSLPPSLPDEAGVIWGLAALDLVSTRAQLLSAGNLLDSAALDPYLLLRDFWVRQHRELTWDGEREVAIGTPDFDDELDELDELDRLDEADELDELDELDRLDRMDELDELDELDRLDALDAATTGESAPLQEALDEVDELDVADELDDAPSD